MPNKITNILDSIQANGGGAVFATVMQQVGTLPQGATPTRQGKYLTKLMSALEETCDAETIRHIMQPCGRLCLSNSTIAKAKGILHTTDDMESFLSQLNAHHIGGGQLHTQNGSIIGVYSHCYCGLGKHAPDLSPSYCHCSAGWYERLFSCVFPDKAVISTLLQSRLSGAEDCRFRIDL